MKYGLRCPVTSKTRLSAPSAQVWDNFTIEFATNNDGYLIQVSVIAAGQDATRYASKAEIDQPAKTLRLHIQRDELLRDEMMSVLHALESFLSIYANLEQIHWDCVEEFVEAESDEEEKLLNVHTWKTTPALHDPDITLSADELHWLITRAKQCKSMTTTISFHREGVNNLRRFQNISAFFNFYFVLEGLYANGKFKSEQVKAEFRRSPNLVAAIEAVMAEDFPLSVGDDRSIPDMLRNFNKPCDVNGLIHLLVHTRGDLHHYAGDKQPAKGSPLLNERYRSLAQFSLKLSQAVLDIELKQMTGEI